MIEWDMYEIRSQLLLNGVMFRGRLRKFALQHDIVLLTENTTDKENGVRFCVISGENIELIKQFILSFVEDAKVSLVLKKVKNPVLSKIKVNDESRYTIS